jgi:hypothetical protein
MNRRILAAALGPALLAVAAGCAGHQAPGPSKVTTPYALKADDVSREASTVVLVTTREAVISPHCDRVAAAGPGGLDELVAKGQAARLPANVTIYAAPFAPITLDSLPDVVTDDGYAGKLCTPHSFEMSKAPG